MIIIHTQAYVKAGAAVYKACGYRRRSNSPFSSSAPTKKVSVSTVIRACTERVCSPLGHVWLVRACVRVQTERVCSDSPILYLYICPLHSNTQSLSLSLSLSLSHTHLLRACVMKSYARLCGLRAPNCGGLNMQREKRDYFY